MSLTKFFEDSGFKVLAMAKLSPCQYSIVLYLINCAASGLNEVITTDSELSSIIDFEEPMVRKAIEDLCDRGMVRVKYGQPHANPDIDSLRIGLQFDLSRWIVKTEEKFSPNDAVVFPFRRAAKGAFHIVGREPSEQSEPDAESTPTWRRVFDSFARGRTLDDEDILRVEEAAHVLVDTHPVDQVLLMIRHFNRRIPTLSLLASSWQHYQELFEEETQRVDMLDARQKHHEQDEKLRRNARTLLSKAEELELSVEERAVLDILIKHRHPRRQLFWAYQARSRYQNLGAFFSDNVDLMLAVTNSGRIIGNGKGKVED